MAKEIDAMMSPPIRPARRRDFLASLECFGSHAAGISLRQPFPSR